jgi:hypothetical protein
VKRAILTVLGTVALVLLAGPGATAEFQGTDVLGNIGPDSGIGGLTDKYPISYFALDYHVDAGITDMDGVPPSIAMWAAGQLWEATRFFVSIVIDLFAWSFSLDLVNGKNGALGPISDAITAIHEHVLGEAWLMVAIVLVGLWGIYKALVQQKYSQTITSLAVSLACALVAFLFIYQPEQTIGRASQWANGMSLAFLGIASQGSIGNPAAAKRDVADHLFETQIYRPWVVLQFGGLKHCVDLDRRNDKGFPRPVAPNDASRDWCRDHAGYATRYLKYPGGSEERNAEYEALKDGKAPDEPQFSGVNYTKADSPAVDIQQQGGAFQRLTLSVIIAAGAAGVIALVGFMSLAIILAQVMALLLLAFSPVALLIGIFPGGQAFFKTWLGKLGTALFIKALYSLVLGVLIIVSVALSDATGSMGFLFAFGLQAVFFWAVFAYRKRLRGHLKDHMVTVDIKSKHKRQLGHAADNLTGAALHPIRSMWPQYKYVKENAPQPGPQPSATAHRTQTRDRPQVRGTCPPRAVRGHPKAPTGTRARQP